MRANAKSEHINNIMEKCRISFLIIFCNAKKTFNPNHLAINVGTIDAINHAGLKLD